MIRCEFDICIYNSEKQCTLENINISPVGCCDDCIMPNLDDKTLDYYKKITLAKFEK